MERGEVQRRNADNADNAGNAGNADNAKRQTPNAKPGWRNSIFFAMIGDAMAYLGTIVSTVRRTHCGFGQNRRLDDQLESRDRDPHYRHPNLHLGDRAWNWR